MVTLTSSSTARLPKDTLILAAISLDIEFSQIRGPLPAVRAMPR
jgi:hypothetical protein